MAEQIYFMDMFPAYEPEDQARAQLSRVLVTGARIDQPKRTIEMDLFCPEYVPQRILDDTAQDICGIYQLRQLELCMTHPADQLQRVEAEELRALFVAQNSMARGSLAGAQWLWEGDILTVQLKGNGKKELEKSAVAVSQNLSRRFDTPVEIVIQAGQDLQGQSLFDATEKLRHQMITDMPTSAAAPQKEAPAVVASDAIFGKPFRGNVVAMKDIDLNMGTVVVEGKVFAVEHKELPKRNAVVIKFDMTDNTSSVRISRFLEKREAEPIMKDVKGGTVVRVMGRLMIDNFTNELVLKPNAIVAGSMPKRKDTAREGKRVELHLHTVMSNMDALTNTMAAIKQAAGWGHKAIAITDHGCCQSFTDALHVVEDWKGAPKVAGTDETIKIL